MKFFEKKYKTFIICPKCKGEDFTDIDPRTETTTYHVFCKSEDCKTDILIPVKDIIKKIIEIK